MSSRYVGHPCQDGDICKILAMIINNRFPELPHAMQSLGYWSARTKNSEYDPFSTVSIIQGFFENQSEAERSLHVLLTRVVLAEQ